MLLCDAKVQQKTHKSMVWKSYNMILTESQYVTAFMNFILWKGIG